MKPLQNYDDATWDRFFDFVYENPEPLSDDEVRQRLEDAGIDMAPAYERLRVILESHRQRGQGPPPSSSGEASGR